MAIWQDLVDDHGFAARYASVRRFVRTLRGTAPAEARVVITTAPGEEAQVDYGEGPMVRDRGRGKYRRTRLFVLTLGYSRKSVRLLVVAVEHADLGGAARARLSPAGRHAARRRARQSARGRAHAGHLRPDAQSALSRRARALRRRRAAVPRPRSRSQGQSRSRRRPRAEDAAARACASRRSRKRRRYLDRWEARWADTRIHGTTKRQVAAMFAEEQPALAPLPLEPFRYYHYGERTVHLDGCVEVEAAYYSAPPGWIGRRVQVQWDDAARPPARSQDRPAAARASAGARAAGIASRTRIDRRGRRRAPLALLRRAPRRAGPHIGALCEHIHQHDGEPRRPPHPGRARPGQEARRRPPSTTPRKAALGSGRAHLPLRPPLPRAPAAGAADAAPGRSAHPPAHPLSRSHRSQDRRPRMNLVELDRALRKLRLSGMADVLETRLRQAQTEQLAPLDLVVDARRPTNCCGAKTGCSSAATSRRGFRDPDRSLDSFDFDFNKKMNRALIYDLATARFVAQREDALFLGPPGTGKSHLAQAIGRAAIQQGYRVALPRSPRAARGDSPTPRSTAPAKTTSPTWRPSRC